MLVGVAALGSAGDATDAVLPRSLRRVSTAEQAGYAPKQSVSRRHHAGDLKQLLGRDLRKILVGEPLRDNSRISHVGCSSHTLVVLGTSRAPRRWTFSAHVASIGLKAALR
jgi:hypothetical protein